MTIGELKQAIATAQSEHAYPDSADVILSISSGDGRYVTLAHCEKHEVIAPTESDKAHGEGFFVIELSGKGAA